MQSYDARILRGAAIPTGLAGLVAIVLALILAGGKGALGAAIGAIVVMAFFTISVLAVMWASKISPMAMMPAALISYTVKLIVMFVLVSQLRDVTAWSAPALAWTVIALTMVWLGGETRTWMQAKTLHLDPEGARPPVKRGSG